MRIQFCRNYSEQHIAEFEVSRAPTPEEVKSIYEYIDNEMCEWEEANDGDFSEFDFWQCCHDAASRYLELVDNPVVKTFYV